MNSTNNNTTSKYILVTGGSGLVGNELIHQLLKKEKKIKALVNKSLLLISHENLTTVDCDLFDVIGLEEAMEDVDEVYHCAGLISYSSHSKSRLFKINVEGTANIVNASLQAGVRKFVHVSSIAALGKFTEGKQIDETMVWTEDARNSVYGYSKFLGEMEVWRGIAEGLNAVIVIPSIILGPGKWDNASTGIFKKVIEGFKWYSEGVNGFVDVRDVAKSMIMLMQSEITAEKFIISAENKSYKEVFFEIADAFNKKRPSLKVNHSLAQIVWRIEKLKNLFSKSEPLITKESVDTALAHVYFNNNKLKASLPEFNYIPISDTIKYTCQILQQKVNNL
ncbi:MAG: NAD-dependent epimerase/dehydratase family protein [Bacteroidota bacterium]